MTTQTVTTIIKKDGTKTTTTRTTKKRAKPKPTFGNGEYSSYQQGVHMLAIHFQELFKKEADTINEFLKYYPMGEFNDKVQAIRQVLLRSICYTSRLANWVIASDKQPPENIHVEEGIDF